MTADTAPESADDATPTGDPVVCDYCGRQFAREEWLALHRGLDHADALDASERAAFESAYEAEEDDLRFFRLQALAALVALYFGFLIVYTVVTP